MGFHDFVTFSKLGNPAIAHGQYEDCVLPVEVAGELRSATMYALHIMKVLF